MKIVELTSAPSEEHDKEWLKEALQAAIELEHATVPAYLCLIYSVIDRTEQVFTILQSIMKEEMLHMGLGCNMLTAIGGTPAINKSDFVPEYPGPLPGGVRPDLTIALAGLSKEIIKDVFMEFEHPYTGEVTELDQDYPTLGKFYDAILNAFRKLDASDFTGGVQITEGDIGMFKIHNLADVELAIEEIKEQGEGTTRSPLSALDSTGELEFPHYYKLGEIYHERQLIKTNDGDWRYEGKEIRFPDCYPVARVPKGGYPGVTDEFNRKYRDLLDGLHDAWSAESDEAGQALLGKALDDMFGLRNIALQLVKTPLPYGKGNYAPDFRLPD